jgi:alcohol dehydrogenase class IV
MRQGVHAHIPQERVIFGRPAGAAVAAEVDRLGARRVLVVAARSMAGTPVAAAIREALGPRFAGLFDGCREHTPWATVLAAAAAVRAAAPDLIVTLGGGTAIDTVKVLQVALAEGARTVEDLARLHIALDADGTRRVPAVGASPVRQIAVPTTLSGAEFSALGGATDERTGLKEAFAGPDICPRSVVLDPAATVFTPERLWLSTGLRAVDHAVEAVCAVDAQPYTDALAMHALETFAVSLRRNKAAPGDLAARLDSQLAVWLAASSIMRVQYGASHGIGHALGALAGVPHGITSCVLLPAVLAWNRPANALRQRRVAAALGRTDGDAARAVADLVADLGLPRTLRDAGVGRELLPRIAEGALKNMWVRTNPRPISGAADVMQILEAAW